MVDAHQNLNGSRDQPYAFQGQSAIRGLAIFNLTTKFEVSISTHYEDINGDTKCRKWGGWDS